MEGDSARAQTRAARGPRRFTRRLHRLVPQARRRLQRSREGGRLQPWEPKGHASAGVLGQGKARSMTIFSTALLILRPPRLCTRKRERSLPQRAYNLHSPKSLNLSYCPKPPA